MKTRTRDLTAQQQLARGPVDLPFLMLVVLLTAVGVITVFSASYASALYESGKPAYYFLKQALFGVGGVVIMWLVSRINYRTFRNFATIGLLASIFLLILVKVPGIGVTAKGANRWIRLPIIGQFQPSEIAKVGVILYFAAQLSQRDKRKKTNWNQSMALGRVLAFLDKVGFLELVPYVAILGIVAALLLWEPHMSGTILVLVGGASVIFASGISWGWIGAGGAVAGAGLWYVMNHTTYMQKRLAIQADPWSDPRGDGYQVIQSIYAIGSGGLLGRGFGQSIQKLKYLPEEHNDYIFSIWCEEMGFIGAILLLILFALLIIRGYWLALHARDKFGALLIVGIITLTAVQVALNVAVVTNLLPPTGISLPFFSYGGTALMIQLVEMGMVLSVSRQIEGPRQG